MSFITPDLSEVVTLSECHQHFSRDLTAILLVRGDDGEKVTVQDFGRSAMKTHNRLSPDQRKQHIYFEFFKMELRKNVSYNISWFRGLYAKYKSSRREFQKISPEGQRPSGDIFEAPDLLVYILHII